MEMTVGVTWCCAALLVALTSVSAIQKLNSINDFKRVDFDQSVPEHSLVLLYWFAHTVFIDSNNVIRLTFNPSNGDYGSHQYHNRENIFDHLPRGQRYYTIGNVNQEGSIPLPEYVLNPPTFFGMENSDRIVIRVRDRVIEEVYLTQHSYNQGTSYDPSYTYQITTNLLREIRKFSMGGNYQTLVNLRNRYGSDVDVSHIRNSLGDLACLGLFLCVVLKKKVNFREPSRRPDKRNNYEPSENRRSDANSTAASKNNCTRRCCIFVTVLIIIVILVIAVLLLTRFSSS